MKKLTSADWDAIQKKRPARYFIQSVADGTLRVIFDSEIFTTERGDQDSLGNVWDKIWTKAEAKIFSFGGTEWTFLNQFIEVCKANEITPEQVPNKVFDITRTGDWEQEIVYVGEESNLDKLKKDDSIKISEDLVRDAKEVIANLKENSPDLVSLGFNKPDFIKVMSIRGKLKSHETEAILPELEKQKILKVEGDRINVL